MKVMFTVGKEEMINWRTFISKNKNTFKKYSYVVYYSERLSSNEYYEEIQQNLKSDVIRVVPKYKEISVLENPNIYTLVQEFVNFSENEGHISFNNVLVIIDKQQYDKELVKYLIRLNANVGIVLTVEDDFESYSKEQNIRHISQLPFKLKSSAVYTSDNSPYLLDYEAVFDLMDSLI